MEKLIYLSNFPAIEIITSALVLQQETKIYFEDSQKVNYELYFPSIFDFRQCVEVAFICREFEESLDERRTYSIFRVDNSEWIKQFISDSAGVYGDNITDYEHYILYDAIDTIIEIISTEPPKLTKIMS